MVIRQCAMKTMDSQCGEFKYQDHTMNGCILTCDFDGCNSGQIKKPNKILQITLSVFVLVFTSYYVNVFKLLRVTIIMNIWRNIKYIYIAFQCINISCYC